jgi:hypothetical protein
MNDNANSLYLVIGLINATLTKPVEPAPVHKVSSETYNDYVFLIKYVAANNTKGNEGTLLGTDIPCIEITVDPYNDLNAFNTIIDIFYRQKNREHSQRAVILKGFGLCISLTLMSPTTFRVIAYKL